MSDELLIAAAPDQIVPSRRDRDLDVPREIAASPALAATPAGTRKAAFAMDSLQLLGFGRRTPAALMTLLDRLERSAGDLP